MVNYILQFFYCLDYDSQSIIQGDDDVPETAKGKRVIQPSLLTYVLVYKIRNYYIVNELRKLALLKFSAELE